MPIPPRIFQVLDLPKGKLNAPIPPTIAPPITKSFAQDCKFCQGTNRVTTKIIVQIRLLKSHFIFFSNFNINI